MIDIKIEIFDRECPGYAFLAARMRQSLAKKLGAGFAEWIFSPKSGRYLVRDYSGTTIEQMLTNCKTDLELIREIAFRYVNVARDAAGPVDFHVYAPVEPGLLARIGLIFPEIDRQRAEARSKSA